MPKKKQTAKKATVVVTVSAERALRQVTQELKAAGLEVEQILEATGIVTGSAEPEKLDGLRAIRGVVDVSPEHTFDIGPPDAPVQ